MKRGFFLNKGTESIRSPIPQPVQTQTNGMGDTTIKSIEHCPNDGQFVHKVLLIDVPPTFDRSQRAADSYTVLFTSIPPSPIDIYGSCECVIAATTKRSLLNTPSYPRPPPGVPPTKAYELRATTMGRGMFALQPLKVGDLILVERPLLLANSNPVDGNGGITWSDPSYHSDMEGTAAFRKSLGIFNAILKASFDRMSKDNQKAYLALPNAHTNDPILAGIWRTNNTHMYFLNLPDKNFTYSAVFREYARINHSCEPNCSDSFDPASFSIQIRATRPISEGEEILISRCELTDPTAKRSAWLSSYGITCTCPSCICNPSIPRDNSIRTAIPTRLDDLERLSAPIDSQGLVAETIRKGSKTPEVKQKLRSNHEIAQRVKEEAIKLMVDMKAQGMDGYSGYYVAVEKRLLANMELSFTSMYDEALFKSEARSQWDNEVRVLISYTKRLFRAHFGSFTKDKLDELFPEHRI